MAKDSAYFIAKIRELSNMEGDPIVTDDEVLGYASAGKSELYDMIVGAYENYAVKTFDFTLVGGVGASSVALPSDFYKEVGVDKDPTNPRPTTVYPFGMIERNSLPGRRYIIEGDNLVISPPELAAGNYRLKYTPLDKPFQEPTEAVTAYPSTTVPVVADTDAVDATLTLANWFFSTASFVAEDIGKMLGITGAANAGNNGLHLVQAVDDATDLRTSKIGLASESFGAGVVAKLYTGPFDSITPGGGGSSIVANQADFSDLVAGDQVTVAGTASSDGVYTVVAVLDAHTVQVAEVVFDVETFAPGVTVSYQEVGTTNVLPQIMVPWYEYIEVHGAIAVKDKIEQDTASLERRLMRLAARVKAMAASRIEEGGQIAMPARSSFWDEDFIPGS